VAEGYIVQTSGEYSVLQMGDIRRLKEEGAHVIVRKAQEREETGNRSKKKKTDSLTGAGFDLFERLRQLRLVIAKEEAMPPYIIFSDKTLIDMCVRVPENQEEMLAVSGVGENKYRKYGERFLQAIAAFLSENPNAVFSTQIDEEVVPAPTAKKGHSSISSAVPRM
ncbi:MAG: HRDC domain-containing protein, partial [Lachnospiraceae bacterium]|nr:HRDC domain-containing protein [Lachnospiraceae bacterium]